MYKSIYLAVDRKLEGPLWIGTGIGQEHGHGSMRISIAPPTIIITSRVPLLRYWTWTVIWRAISDAILRSHKPQPTKCGRPN